MSTSFNALEAAVAKLDMSAIAASAAASAASGVHYNSNSTSTSSSHTSSPLTPPNSQLNSPINNHSHHYNNLKQCDYGNFTSREVSISDLLGLNLPRGTSLGTTSYSSPMSISPSTFGSAAPQRPSHLTRFNNHNNNNHTSCNINNNGSNGKIQQPQSHTPPQQQQRQTSSQQQPPTTPQQQQHQHQHLHSHHCQGTPSNLAHESIKCFDNTKLQHSTPISSQQPSVHSHIFPGDIQSNRCSEIPHVKLLQRNWDSILHTMPYYASTYKSASPTYSDSGSPTALETAFMLGSGSRSHSPADSETSTSSFGEYMQNSYSAFPSPRTQGTNQIYHHHNAASPGLGLVDPSSPDIASNVTPSLFHPLTTMRYPLPQANLLSSLLHYQTLQNPLIDKSLFCNNPLGYNDPNPLEKAAKFYRNSASFCNPHTKWEGALPPKTNNKGPFSCKAYNAVSDKPENMPLSFYLATDTRFLLSDREPKCSDIRVFLGGVPWDIHEAALMNAFKQFGEIQVEWPGKDQGVSQTKGFCYIILESEKQVKAMLTSCTHDAIGGNYFYKISSRKMKSKVVQVIPWHLSDSNYVSSSSQKLDPLNTVFVGALHGMLTAEGLAHIMNKLFEGVVYAGIDTDKHKYPIGSGRVTFDNNRSYMRAVAAAFIEIKTLKFTKKVQVDPYLEDSLCSECNLQQGPYFCREMICFRYFCTTCWHNQHSRESFTLHKPLMRNCKSPRLIGFGRRPLNI